MRLQETHIVPAEVGLLHHYRSFEAPPDPQYVEDRAVPNRFSDALLRLVGAAHQRLHER